MLASAADDPSLPLPPAVHKKIPWLIVGTKWELFPCFVDGCALQQQL